MAPREKARGHRVLIAAFVLPDTVEFRADEKGSSEETSGPLSAPSSPVPRPANTQHLADMLSTRLQIAVNQQETRAASPRNNLPHLGSASNSRHSSFTQRERVSMAELMAEASGSGTAYLQPAGSAIASTPPSPNAQDITFDARGALDARPGPGTMSDHGRRASQQSADPARIQRSRRNSGNTGLPQFLTPLGPKPSVSPHGPPQRSPTPHGVRDMKSTPPASIISDMAAKQNSQSTAVTPAPQEQNPFGAGVVTPMPPGSHGPRTNSTPLLMERPELASGWTNAQDEGDATLRPPEHLRGSSSAPSKPGKALVPKCEAPVPVRAQSGLQVLPSGRVTVSNKPTPDIVPDTVNVKRPRNEPGETTASGTIHRRGSLLRRSTQRAPSMRSRSSSHAYRGPQESEESAVPFDFVPNPGANYGLINAVNSVGDERLPNGKLYVGTLGIEMNWIPESLRTKIDHRARVEHDCVPVWLKDEDYVSSYHHYCKQILWPTFHYTLPSAQGLQSEHRAFRAYVEVNRRFAERIVEVYEEGDVVWVQDYHLLLVPHMVRERLPHATIGLFVHIAFPSSEIFRCLSMREVLLRGMLGADLVGFQTHNFCRHFRQTVSRILQLEATPRGIQLRRAFVTVAPFPIGIDVRTLNRKRENPEVMEWVERLEERFAGKHVIVGRDKLDWIKGVREKLLAFEVFLDEHPEWVGRVVLVQVALATVQENKEVGEATDIVARINRKHSSLMYQPVVFLHVQELTFSQYLALLTMADVFLATSLREGMNLTSHEYVIAQESRKRPLILSEFTGTYSALRACIGINPWNTRQVAGAIYQALTMQEEEREQRWYDLHRTVVTQTAQHWITSVLSQLERAHQQQPSIENVFIPRLEIAQLVSEWRASRSRMILVDLEQTLVLEDPVEVHMHGFRPQPALVRLLKRLTSDRRNYVYLLSGKGTVALDRIAAQVPEVGLVAENGCFVRHCASPTWISLVDGFNLEWRKPVLEILAYFTERTPGSWIEERQASVSWHFNERTEAETGADRQWAHRQAAEVQSLIYDSLGERFSIRILHSSTRFNIMPKNVSRTSAVQYILSLDAMGALPPRPTQDAGKDMFSFVLQIGKDEHLISYLNQLDLTFAPRTCTTTESSGKPNSDASYHLAPGADVLAALEEIVDLRMRDLKWGGPAMLDV